MKFLKPKADITDHLLAILIVIILWVVVDSIHDTAKAHYDDRQNRVEPKPWTPPPIPKCDKELWLRIKDGCKEEDDGG